MSGLILCLSAAALGVDYGWQPVAGGGIEYIIQIEPELLDSLKDGHDLFSDLPPAMRNIRSYRITVGSGQLPHHGEPPPGSAGPNDLNGPASGASGTAAGPATEIDLSQLPGPILGPALFFHPPENQLEADEPPRLAEGEAKPLANRVAGYHGKSDASPPDAAAGAASEKERPAEKSDDQKGKSSAAGAAKTANAGTPEQGSTADRATTFAQPARGSAVMQLGLFTSLCANAFLLWVAAGQRSSYRALLRRMFDRHAQETAELSVSSSTPRHEQIAEPQSGAALPDHAGRA